MTPMECEEKWADLLVGLDGQQKTAVAWCIEQEIGYLQKTDHTLLPSGFVRYTPPIVRVAATKLVPESAVDALARIPDRGDVLTLADVRDAVASASNEVEERDSTTWERTERFETLLLQVADRLYDSMLRLKEALR